MSGRSAPGQLNNCVMHRQCGHSAQKENAQTAKNIAFDEFKINLHLRTSRFFSIAQTHAFCQALRRFFVLISQRVSQRSQCVCPFVEV